MEKIYINSKGEEVVIKEMAVSHILYSIAKNANYIGLNDHAKVDPEGCVRKEAENKNFHEEVTSRFAELSEKVK